MGCLFLFRDAEMTNVTPGVLLESFLFFSLSQLSTGQWEPK